MNNLKRVFSIKISNLIFNFLWCCLLRVEFCISTCGVNGSRSFASYLLPALLHTHNKCIFFIHVNCGVRFFTSKLCSDVILWYCASLPRPNSQWIMRRRWALHFSILANRSGLFCLCKIIVRKLIILYKYYYIWFTE